MSMFVAIRLLHILLAALWLGAALVLSTFVVPGMRQAGRAGDQVLVRVMQRGLHVYMATISGTTVLTGLVLYWQFTSGLTGTLVHSHAGIALGLGGILGVVTAAIGGGVIGRSFKGIVALSAQPGDNTTEIAKLHDRAAAGARLAAILLVAAFALMAVARYV